MVPPTPGPLSIAEILSIDIGIALPVGLLSSIPLALIVLWVSGWFDQKYKIPIRPVGGVGREDLQSILDKDLNDLPPLVQSYVPVLLPVFLISAVSLVKVLDPSQKIQGGELFQILSFLGDPNIAMSLAALVSIFLLVNQWKTKELSNETKVGKVLEAPLMTAGSIILITGAGGAYGGMIRLCGVGECIADFATTFEISYILLAWGITALIRIAQGSATVAMMTGAGLMASVIGDGSSLSYHPCYLFLAIGFGSITLSWMNDSGFWVVQKLSGLNEKEMLRTWSLLLTVISVCGLMISLLGSVLIPMN